MNIPKNLKPSQNVSPSCAGRLSQIVKFFSQQRSIPKIHTTDLAKKSFAIHELRTFVFLTNYHSSTSWDAGASFYSVPYRPRRSIYQDVPSSIHVAPSEAKMMPDIIINRNDKGFMSKRCWKNYASMIL